MKLAHTLLFMLRENRLVDDLILARACLKSLEGSAYPTVVVYNQGFWTSAQVRAFLALFRLEAHVIGDGVNVGTAAGRQRCFEYIWNHMPECAYISELHLDMIFPGNWEEALTDYLDCHDEPMVCAGIIDGKGAMPFLGKSVPLPEAADAYDHFLKSLREDRVVHGFTNPCIHACAILKAAGGYDTQFLRGSQCFEDDSMLLGYFYYYGIRHNWYPKVNFNTVVYHAIAGQRLGMNGDVKINFDGLVKQYGTMGLVHLSSLHESQWHQAFFKAQCLKQLSR